MINTQMYIEFKKNLKKRIDVKHEPSDELIMNLLEAYEVQCKLIEILKNDNKVMKVYIVILLAWIAILGFFKVII